MRRRGLPLLITLVGLAICRYGHAQEITVAGEPQVVFASRTSGCGPDDIPDAPARAFKDAKGTIRLFASHWRNRSFTGPTLEALDRDCHTAFQAGADEDPAAFDDRIWLTSFWIGRGDVVHALGHAEYHGHLRPSVCPAGRYKPCWWNAIVQFVSTDGGETFRRANGRARGLIASLPYRYDPSHGRPAGYFSPTNIIQRNGYWYVFVFAESYGAQPRGACLLRSADLEDPAAWRGWDGRDFTMTFSDASADDGSSPDEHICAPLPRVASTISSVARLPDGRFVALIAASRRSGPDEASVAGVYYMVSANLIDWSEPRLLLAAPILFAFSCEAKWAYAYPSLLDGGESASQNFEDIGNKAFLYLTRIHVRDCRPTMERELVRYPIAAPE